MLDDRRCIFVSLSTRSLAASAAKAGIEVHAIDCFSDLDTETHAIQTEIVDLDKIGLDSDSVIEAIERSDPDRQLPVIYSGGLEHSPNLLGRIARHRRLLGNSAESVQKVCNPKIFFSELATLGVPHPQTQLSRPCCNESWLMKTTGGSGGLHIEKLSDTSSEEDIYFQRLVGGKTVTATVIAGEQDVQTVGFTEQWCSDDIETKPFTYGGAVSIDSSQLSQGMRRDITRAVDAVTKRFDLKGLMSFDMIVEGDEWYLLEVNPRPSATFELHEGDESFIRAHWDVFDGKQPNLHSVTLDGVFRAHCIVYAVIELRIPADWTWPDWVSDQSKPNLNFSPGDPVCTVNAESFSSESAKKIVFERHREIFRVMQSWTVGDES